MRTPVGSSNRSARSSAENSPAAAPSGVTFTVCAPAAPTFQNTHASTAMDHRRYLAISFLQSAGISVLVSKPGACYIRGQAVVDEIFRFGAHHGPEIKSTPAHLRRPRCITGQIPVARWMLLLRRFFGHEGTKTRRHEEETYST